VQRFPKRDGREPRLFCPRLVRASTALQLFVDLVELLANFFMVVFHRRIRSEQPDDRSSFAQHAQQLLRASAQGAP